MAVYVFVVEFCVEGGVDFCGGFVFCCEDYADGDVFVFLLFAFFEEAFWAQDEGVGVFFVPGAEEDVMLLMNEGLDVCVCHRWVVIAGQGCWARG